MLRSLAIIASALGLFAPAVHAELLVELTSIEPVEYHYPGYPEPPNGFFLFSYQVTVESETTPVDLFMEAVWLIDAVKPGPTGDYVRVVESPGWHASAVPSQSPVMPASAYNDPDLIDIGFRYIGLEPVPAGTVFTGLSIITKSPDSKIGYYALGDYLTSQATGVRTVGQIVMPAAAIPEPAALMSAAIGFIALLRRNRR